MERQPHEIYEILLEILKDIRDSGPKLMHHGICDNVYHSYLSYRKTDCYAAIWHFEGFI